MTNNEKMKSYLKKYVFPRLYEKGFTGKWPHFRRELDNCIELIVFETNKWGGSFRVEVSAVFPKYKNSNYYTWDGLTEDKLTVWNTNKRYCLKGMYGGEFYYHDLYSEHIKGHGHLYCTVSEKKAAEFVMPDNYRLIKKFDDEAAVEICNEINEQFVKAFRWLYRFEKKKRK